MVGQSSPLNPEPGMSQARNTRVMLVGFGGLLATALLGFMGASSSDPTDMLSL